MCPSRDEVRAVSSPASSASWPRSTGSASVHLDYIRVSRRHPAGRAVAEVQPRAGQGVSGLRLLLLRGLPRRASRRQSGVDPRDLPDPPAIARGVQYRYDTITDVVGMLVDEVHDAAASAITAAVFPTPTIAKTLVRQDWTRWKLDAVLPMIYNGFYKEDVAVDRARHARRRDRARRAHPALQRPLRARSAARRSRAGRRSRARRRRAAASACSRPTLLTPEHWTRARRSC